MSFFPRHCSLNCMVPVRERLKKKQKHSLKLHFDKPSPKSELIPESLIPQSQIKLGKVVFGLRISTKMKECSNKKVMKTSLTKNNVYYTSNHQNIDCVVIAINLHVLPDMPSCYLLFRICTLVIYCSGYPFLCFIVSDFFLILF